MKHINIKHKNSKTIEDPYLMKITPHDSNELKSE